MHLIRHGLEAHVTKRWSWAVFPCYALFLVALILPLSVAGWGPLYNETDGQYAAAAQTMVQGGSWLIPENNRIPRLVKPPFLYWCMALSFKLFGINEFAARVPNALAVFAWIVFTYLIGARVGGARLGLQAGWILLTSLGTFALGRIIMPEPMFAAFIAAAFYCVLQGMQVYYQPTAVGLRSSTLRPLPSASNPQFSTTSPSRQQRLWYIGFWLCVSLACFVKGWHGVVLALMIVFVAVFALPFASATRHSRSETLKSSAEAWRQMRGLISWEGIALLLLINAPWFIYVEFLFPGYLTYFIFDEGWGHVSGTDAPATSYTNVPRFQFLLLHLVWFFPWSIVVLGGLIAQVVALVKGFVKGWAMRRGGRMVTLEAPEKMEWPNGLAERFGWSLIWAWAVVSFGVLMLAGQRQDYYSMLAWPPCAIGMAWGWGKIFQRIGNPVQRGLQSLVLGARSSKNLAALREKLSALAMCHYVCGLYGLGLLFVLFVVGIGLAGTLLLVNVELGAPTGMADRATAWTTLGGLETGVWKSLSVGMLVVCLTGACCCGIGLWLSLHGKPSHAFAMVVITAIIICLGAVWGVDKVSPYFSHVAHAKWILKNCPKDTVVYFDGQIDTGSSLLFYLKRSIVLVDQDPDEEFAVRRFGIGRDRFIDSIELTNVFQSRANVVLITEKDRLNAWEKALGPLEVVLRSGSQQVVRKMNRK